MLIANLGTQPHLSLAELERVFGDAKAHSSEIASFSGDVWPHLGGTSKIAEVLTTLPTTNIEQIFDHLKQHLPQLLQLPEQKFDIGISLHGKKFPKQHQLIFSLKRHLKQAGFKPRFILGNDQTLSSAQVFHNQLHSKGYELIVSIGESDTILARTLWVQDIDSYTRRDMDRPRRDMNVGMLPPKLAQIMLNLAGGKHVYDPFCGTGVILQEALLMGRVASGSDLSQDMVDATGANLNWLSQNFSTPEPNTVFLADATEVTLPQGVDAVVTEGFLGPIMHSEPNSRQAAKLAASANGLLESTLSNLYPQLPQGAQLCIAAPAWRTRDGDIKPALADWDSSLPGVDPLKRLGYNRMSLNSTSSSDLLYRRANQYVGRHLILLEKP